MDELQYQDRIHRTLWNRADPHCAGMLAGRLLRSGRRFRPAPGLLRRVSRQRLAAAFAPAPKPAWPVAGLRAKYGIEPAPL